MHRLRNNSALIGTIFGWFMLTIVVVCASSYFNPKTWSVICTSSGAISVSVMSPDGEGELSSSKNLDCPLCLANTLITSEVNFKLLNNFLNISNKIFYLEYIAAILGAPLPARGPPYIISS